MTPKDIEIRSVHYKTLDNGACGVEVEWTTPDLIPEEKYDLYSLSFDLYQRYCSDETIFDWCRKCIYENYYRKRINKMKPKEVSSNGLSLEQELERRDRWLEDLRIRYKELQSKYEKLKVKASPMKPKKIQYWDLEHTRINKGYCRKCDYQVFLADGNYCPHCGQALDWSK